MGSDSILARELQALMDSDPVSFETEHNAGMPGGGMGDMDF
jgi:hypothetical protein